MKRFRVIGTIGLVLAVVGYFSFLRWQSHWYAGVIPASIEITEAVVISGESHFREGCGTAVFKLSSSAREHFRAGGLAALATAKQARNRSDSYGTYSQWKETPYVITGDGLTLIDRWQLGLECARLGDEFRQSIFNAMKTSGSFYARTYEAGLVVIPSLGWAVFAYDG